MRDAFQRFWLHSILWAVIVAGMFYAVFINHVVLALGLTVIQWAPAIWAGQAWDELHWSYKENR